MWWKQIVFDPVNFVARKELYISLYSTVSIIIKNLKELVKKIINQQKYNQL